MRMCAKIIFLNIFLYSCAYVHAQIMRFYV